MTAEKIRRIYSIVLGAMIAALGIAFVCVAADIYYSGRGTGVIYTREIAAERLTALAIPFVVVIGATIVGAIFPAIDVKAKNSPEHAVSLLQAKAPTDGGDEFVSAKQNYDRLEKTRVIVWACLLVGVLGCVIAELCYVLDTAHFLSENVTAEIFAMTKNVLPFVAVSFALLIGGAVFNGVISSKKSAALKIMIKTGDRSATAVKPRTKTQKIAAALSGDIAVWIVRGAIFAVAVAFIIAGVLNGGAHDVLVKAVNICTECIGLG